jgi:hypothetical protein
LLLNFTLGFAVRNGQVNQVGLKSNGTHQLLAYVNDVNLLESNVDTINKNIETLVDASKEVSLEVNAREKIPVYVAISSPESGEES